MSATLNPTLPAPQIGRSPQNRRADALVRGDGLFVDDVELVDALSVAFVRAQVAPGRLSEPEMTEARTMPGVVAVHSGADVAGLGDLSVSTPIPKTGKAGFPVLAFGQVGFAGQPVAAVLAKTSDCAQDAAEAVYAGIEETDAAADTTPLASQHWKSGDAGAAFANADHIVACCIEHKRLAPAPMEPRSIAVQYHLDGDTVTVWHSTQTPHRSRGELASILGIDASRIRVIAPDVGGAFGMKASLYPEEVFVVWAAFHHRRSVRWAATRSEDFLSATQGRGLTCSGRMALDKHGKFLALEARIEAPVGCWLPTSALIPAWNAARILPGGYDIDVVDISTSVKPAPFAPTGIYRGAGRPEANLLLERLVDKAARVIGLDPTEIRHRNLLSSRVLTHRTVTGNLLDSGDYSAALDHLVASRGWASALDARTKHRANGDLYGLGIGFFLEPSGSGWESARVTLHSDGTVTVASGSSSQGHGRETALAQIAADALGLDLVAVGATCGDTGTCPEGIGALASRSTAIGGSAVMAACTEVLDRKNAGEPLPITADVRYENEGQAWGYGAYMAAVEIDPDTGSIRIDKVVCVDDAGIVVNPALAKGQIRGGFAQGLGEALMEQIVYDDGGQLLTGSFMDYAMPRASDVPPLDFHSLETLSPFNLLGAKGIAEAGTIGAPAALLNAAIDALSPLGIEDLDMPLTPQKIWHAITAARKDT